MTATVDVGAESHPIRAHVQRPGDRRREGAVQAGWMGSNDSCSAYLAHVHGQDVYGWMVAGGDRSGYVNVDVLVDWLRQQSVAVEQDGAAGQVTVVGGMGPAGPCTLALNVVAARPRYTPGERPTEDRTADGAHVDTTVTVWLVPRDARALAVALEAHIAFAAAYAAALAHA